MPGGRVLTHRSYVPLSPLPDGSFSVIGTGGANDPLSLTPQSHIGSSSAASSSSTPVILQQQQVSNAAPTIAQPKKASTTTTSKKTTTTSSKAASAMKAAKSVERKDDDDEDEGDQEEIIPHKVPYSDESEDDEPTAKRGVATQLSPSKSASGAREKTFLSEVDLEELKPASFGQ
jgi:hypothetical protein